VTPDQDTAGLARPEYELAILAHAVANPAILDGIAGRLLPEHFFDAALGAIYETACGLRAERRPVNRITLGALIAGNPLDGGTELDRLRNANLEDDPQDLADALIDLHRRRRLRATGEWLAGAANEPRTSPSDLITATMRELDAMASASRPAQRTDWDAADGIDDMLASMASDDREKYIPTRFVEIDRKTGGLRRTSLTTLAGRPGMGKSGVAVAIGNNVARSGVGVQVFSLEMSKDEWLARAVSETTQMLGQPVPYSDALRGGLNPFQRDAFAKASLRLRELPLRIDEQPALTSGEIKRRTRRSAMELNRRGVRLGLVIIDYLGIMRATDRYKGNRVMEVGEITAAMKALAKSEDIAVLALHQLNRNVEARDNKRPMLSDLRESGSVEQDSDVVLFAYRDTYYLGQEKYADGSPEEAVRLADVERTKNEIEVIISKNRHGPSGTAKLWCDMSLNAFANLDTRERPR
jgi:replicative DNA helicase